jgi:Contractile injection system tube protein
VAQVRIVGLEGQTQGVTLQAQVTAKEIIVSRAVTWQPQQSGPDDLTYIGTGPTMMRFELLFDGVDSATPVQPDIANLHQFSDIDPILKRPPKIEVSYGPTQLSGIVPPIQAVIEACAVRYLVFDASGVALRALVTLTCKQADKVSAAHQLP